MLSVFWVWHVPIPGVAVGGLGAVGVLLAIKGEKLQEGHKVVWALITLVFLVTEVRAIKEQDQKNTDTMNQILCDFKEASSQNQLNFEATSGQIQTSITNSTKRFDETTAKEDNVLDDITGGKTFSVVEALPLPSKFQFDAIAVGPNPLHNVLIDEFDSAARQEMIGTPQFTFDEIQRTTTHYTVPFLTSMSAYLLGQVESGDGRKRSFHFNFFGTNGVWREDLLLRRTDTGAWLQAFKVSRDVPRKDHRCCREIVLCKGVPADFPITPADDPWVKQHSECRAK